MSRQRGSTWQADFVRKDGARLRPGGFTDEAAANLWEAMARVADDKGEDLPPIPTKGRSILSTSETTLGELRTLVLQTSKPDGWKGSKDIRNAEERSQMAVDFFGAGRRISMITVTEVDRWIAALTKLGNSGSTINRKVAALSKMLTFARKRGLIAAAPHMARQHVDVGRIRFLSHAEEAQALLALSLTGASADQMDLTVYLIDTGARVSEALNLGPTDATAASSTYWTTKGGKPRTVPHTPRLQAIMAQRVGREAGPFAAVNYWTYRAAWDRARATLGKAFEDVVIHTFRHTCCSRFVQAGRDLHRVMKWMGHADFKTTLGYAHLAPNSFDGMLDDLVDMRTKSAVEQSDTNVTALVPKRAAA